MSLELMNKYDWSQVDGRPVEEVSSFAITRTRNLFADVTKQEQLMADTLQQFRVVALVHGNIVVEYNLCVPNPNSPHRIIR